MTLSNCTLLISGGVFREEVYVYTGLEMGSWRNPAVLDEPGNFHPQHAWFVRCSRPVFSKGDRRPLVYSFSVSICLLGVAVCVCCSLLCFT